MPRANITHGRLVLFCFILFISNSVIADGVLRDGFGTRSMGLGGASLVFPDNALSAMNANPAALANWQNNQWEIGGVAGSVDGEFDNAISSGNKVDSAPGFYPDVAYVRSINSRWTLGLSINPVSAVETNWNFADPPGVLGGYGKQDHYSSFLALRSAVGLGFQANPQWSFGASVGLIYNRNRLKAPYIFQSHPLLGPAGIGGANVLVNLEADGFGVNGVFSTNYQPTDNLTLSLGYTTPTHFNANGTLRGNGNVVGPFSYDAEVKTELPQVVSGGFNWKANDKLQLGIQLDWVDWASAFDKLPIHLTNGSNVTLNGIVGSTRLDDTAPLNWSDEVVLRLGIRYDWSDRLQLRAGYSYGNNPVAAQFMTPTTAAITEHLISFGAGYHLDNYLVNIAYQWELPNKVSVANSQLASVEYDNTRTDISIHWISLSVEFDSPF